MHPDIVRTQGQMEWCWFIQVSQVSQYKLSNSLMYKEQVTLLTQPTTQAQRGNAGCNPKSQKSRQHVCICIGT